MKTRLASFVLGALLPALPFAPSAATAGDPPVNDLTITVEELENGDIRFTASGTSTMQESGPVSYTNFGYNIPPADPSVSGRQELPEGMTLSIPEFNSEPEGGAEAGPGVTSAPIGYLYFGSGSWWLGDFEFNLPVGVPITGEGSVAASGVPFGFFAPGTYVVEAAIIDDSVEEATMDFSDVGYYSFQTTYVVIPFTPSPALSIASPVRFPATRLGRSSRPLRVVISNKGNASLNLGGVSLSGPGAREFSTTKPAVSMLEPGQSTFVSAKFRPRRKGLRRANLTVVGSTIPREIVSPRIPSPRIPEGAEEGLLEPQEPETPIEVSATSTFMGRGIVPKKPRPGGGAVGTPRFPRGPLTFHP